MSSTEALGEATLSQWAEMMGDEIMTTAMLDRLLHHAHIFSLDGDSYRVAKPSTMEEAAVSVSGE